jgi:hypothetical protein
LVVSARSSGHANRYSTKRVRSWWL